jgi:hypothetical protein
MWMLSSPYQCDGVEIRYVASLRTGRMQDLFAATPDGHLVTVNGDEWVMLASDGIDAHGRRESRSVDEQFARIGYTTTR